MVDGGPHGSSGYVHGLPASRFRIGVGVATELDTPAIVRWRGSLGAFALDPTNGWTMALLDSTSPVGPYILDAGTHEAAVRAYFVSAGIPEDEISAVKSNFELGGGGSTSDPAAAPEFRSISSVLHRAVGGIPVPESYAWAKMTTGGDVDAESVYWPAIAAVDVSTAVAFADKLADANARADFVSKLPGPIYRDGGVALHVTHWGLHTPALAIVTYDATIDPWPQAAMRHFKESGEEIRLPHESVKPSGSSSRAP